ncbi:hypothetical protein G3576_00405 [Roseomonas stagni]|uniref:Uncharacterized protein n=1 Tax=Falsiroseomonas algicola TaxID=2716930 RepID=A0A6M1LDX1_9PROT|nr:hypothetical protein [Falsiroseomonas algicola]NGM18456.1 hypothetical protein [Falsiroseomonas algicola]
MATRNSGPDPVRARILDAARDRRLGLKALSLRLGRNPSYLQQFVARGTPKRLPEDLRQALATMLGLPEAALRPEGASPLPAPPGRRLPLFREGEDRIASGVTPARRLAMEEFAPAEPGMVAVMLAEPRGLLQPRHLLLCDPGQPARVGDVVLVVEAGAITGLGLLQAGTRERIDWIEDGTARSMARSQAHAWRVVAMRLA